MTVISYDITDNKRRTRFANFLLDYAVRVQYSVFECHGNSHILEKIRKKATEELDADTDNVIFYHLLNSKCPKEVIIGEAGFNVLEKEYLIF